MMSQARTAFTWVYLGTNIEYLGDVNSDSLAKAKVDPNTNEIIQGLLCDADTANLILIEKISRKTLSERTQFYDQHVWVDIAKMKRMEDNFFNLEALTNTNIVNGVITSGTLMTPDGDIIDLLLVSRSLYNSRLHSNDLICVYKDSYLRYTDRIDASKLILIESSSVIRGSLLLDNGNTINLDFITPLGLTRRRLMQLGYDGRFWVTPGTCEIVTYPHSAKLINEINNQDSLTRLFMLGSGDYIELEGISSSILNRREGYSDRVWINEETGELYKGVVDANSLTDIRSKMGNLTGATLVLPNGRNILLSYVARRDISSRKRVWINANTLEPFSYPKDTLIQNEMRATGILKRKLLLRDGSIVEVEHISKSALRARLRKKRSSPSSMSISNEASSSNTITSMPNQISQVDDARSAKRPRTETTSSSSSISSYARMIGGLQQQPAAIEQFSHAISHNKHSIAFNEYNSSGCLPCPQSFSPYVGNTECPQRSCYRNVDILTAYLGNEVSPFGSSVSPYVQPSLPTTPYISNDGIDSNTEPFAGFSYVPSLSLPEQQHQLPLPPREVQFAERHSLFAFNVIPEPIDPELHSDTRAYFGRNN